MREQTICEVCEEWPATYFVKDSTTGEVIMEVCNSCREDIVFEERGE